MAERMKGEDTARKGRRAALLITAALLALLLAWLIWGNTALMTSCVTVKAADIPAGFDGFRIAQVSDLHNTEFGEGNARLLDVLREAAPDRLLIPFAENYRWLRELLPQCADSASEELAGCICTLGERYAARLTPQTEAPAQPEVLSALTAREKEIAGLAAARLSNREIAEKLFLSEGSVKQYINQIYAKLGLDGDTRTKRRRLSELLNDNP